MFINLFQTSIASIVMLYMYMPFVLALGLLVSLDNTLMIRLMSMIYFLGYFVLIHGIDITNNLKRLKGIYTDYQIAKSTFITTIVFTLMVIVAMSVF